MSARATRCAECGSKIAEGEPRMEVLGMAFCEGFECIGVPDDRLYKQRRRDGGEQ